MTQRLTKRERVIYWLATGAVCAVMVFSAINFNLKVPMGPMKGAFKHLGYPDYLRIELTIAKALGVLALLIPIVPIKVKEFAYAGFAITLASASIAHFSVGDPALFVVDPLFFLAALIVSYVGFQKKMRVETEPWVGWHTWTVSVLKRRRTNGSRAHDQPSRIASTERSRSKGATCPRRWTRYR